jgi:hypothetical protein
VVVVDTVGIMVPVVAVPVDTLLDFPVHTL